MKRLFFPIVLVATVALGGVFTYGIWKAHPLTAQGYFESGKSYYDQKKYAEAIVQFLNAKSKDAGHRDARYYLALSYLAQQNPNNAVSELGSLVEYYPDDADANLELGALYLAAARG